MLLLVQQAKMMHSNGKVYIFNVTTGFLVSTLDNPNAYGTKDNDNFGLYLVTILLLVLI